MIVLGYSIGKAGVSPREHQDLARHSTYALTSRYSHSRFYDLAAAVQSLPIPITGPGPDTLAATGTEGKISRKKLTPQLTPRPATSGDFLRQTETETGKRNKQKTPENKPFLAFSGEIDSHMSNYPQGDSNPCLLAENQTS